MTLTVNVTQKHIDRGREHDCKLCPIELALREQHQECENYWVGVFSVYNGHTREFTLPPLAQVFVHEFDKGHPVEPFTFELTDEATP